MTDLKATLKSYFVSRETPYKELQKIILKLNKRDKEFFLEIFALKLREILHEENGNGLAKSVGFKE